MILITTLNNKHLKKPLPCLVTNLQKPFVILMPWTSMPPTSTNSSKASPALKRSKSAFWKLYKNDVKFADQLHTSTMTSNIGDLSVVGAVKRGIGIGFTFSNLWASQKWIRRPSSQSKLSMRTLPWRWLQPVLLMSKSAPVKLNWLSSEIMSPISRRWFQVLFKGLRQSYSLGFCISQHGFNFEVISLSRYIRLYILLYSISRWPVFLAL